MNQFNAFIICILTFFGCGSPMKSLVTEDCITNNSDFAPIKTSGSDNYTLAVHDNATLFLFQDGEQIVPQIENGKKLVFEYRYTKSVNPLMKDAGYNESILFEIDPEVNKFLLNGALLEKAKAMYGNLCFCPDAGYHPIKEGCIRGKKTGKDEWQVDINIKAYGTDREFTKSGN